MNYISTNILYIQYFPQTLLHPFGKRQCIEANAATFPDIVLLKDQKGNALFKMHILVDRQPMMSAFIWATPQMTFPGCFCGWKAFDYKDCCFINFSANVFLQICSFSSIMDFLCVFAIQLSQEQTTRSGRLCWEVRESVNAGWQLFYCRPAYK